MTVGPDQADPSAPVAADAIPEEDPQSGFQVKLTNFEGPFDLLLDLISNRRLDVTEVALHAVTDDFIAYTRQLGADMELDQTTQFLVVAATLLDLKAARLLPSGEVENPEDLALLEARDLLFARLLQYRAYKQVAVLFAELEAAALQRYPRAVSLEPHFEALLPEVDIGVDAAGLAEVMVTAMTPKVAPTVGLDHLHVAKVSVPEQAVRITELLRAEGPGRWTDFSALIAECETGLQVVARFLAVLELFRAKTVDVEQPEALGDLKVCWTGDDVDTGQIVAAEEEYG
ncbi:segregation and condensation protein A [Williamsia sterculiae]|uniref:Segregation and condensation protein A n=1 Tax=Williamsia sterculiae TaxID=1344003 RepID=A0A1N7H4A8_9NOCA|nr:segregation/condensation protein A [Williamsia sterculiae]SIS19560.1 condensin subunit ScpA [Williamsia sterculiae]